MTKRADEKAEDLEQRYVGERVETERMLEGLDPSDPESDRVEQVEAAGDDSDAEHVEKMARDD